MTDKKPIHVIAKDLGIDSSKVVKACNIIGIEAKGASKRLDNDEENRIISYFKTGKNVANEVIDINNDLLDKKQKGIYKQLNHKSNEYIYFPNRLIK